MRRAAKRDDNEALIVTALQSAGWTVVRVSDAGAPDLICVRMGEISLVEVKGPKGTLTPAQGVAFERLNKAGVAVLIVRSPGDALIALGAPRHVLEPNVGPQWLAVNGSAICESCWLPENGLHARDCPNRTRLKPKPAVQSAYRAAKTLEEAMPKIQVRAPPRVEWCKCGHSASLHSEDGRVCFGEECPCLQFVERPSRGVEGELQPLKVKR
jgi:hypothetical protein